MDEDYGWCGFRDAYNSSTWRWLYAAFNPRFFHCEQPVYSLPGKHPGLDILASHSKNIYHRRFLLSSASLSEESLCRVCGKKFSYKSFSFVINSHFHQGTLGISRREVTSFFKDPRRGNVFQQVRHVDIIDTRSTGVTIEINWHFHYHCWATEIPLFIERHRNHNMGFLILLAASRKKVQVQETLQ